MFKKNIVFTGRDNPLALKSKSQRGRRHPVRYWSDSRKMSLWKVSPARNEHTKMRRTFLWRQDGNLVTCRKVDKEKTMEAKKKKDRCVMQKQKENNIITL